MTDIYFRFIQFSLGIYPGGEFLDGSALKDFDWNAFYDFCRKQTLVGVAFDGIQRLPKGTAPHLELLMMWFGMSRKIKQHNVLLNRATAAVYKRVTAAGYSCCILKGQGNAVMYPDPSSRAPGDVDVWIKASREDIRSLAALFAKECNGRVDDESLNHIGLMLNGIAVELHFTPGFMANVVYHRRLQQWLKRNVDGQCANMVDLPDGVGSVAVPMRSFNIVYQLYHLYHHYFYEGVGLRQVVDYYYALARNEDAAAGERERCRRSEDELKALRHELRHLGLWKFAGAMMYVLREVMRLPDEAMIAPVDTKRGRLLLDDILNGGNFGHYDQRHAWGRDSYGDNGFRHGALGHNMLRLLRDFRLLRYYPSEAFSEPFFRIWHFVWRRW